jgi:pseudouridine-5'-monophosphatase
LSLKSPIRAVLFDLDGVLLDTEPLYSQATQAVLNAYGKRFEWSLKREMIGRSDIESAELLVSRLELPISAREYLALYEPQLDALFVQAPPMPGAEELVAALDARRVPIAVGTSSRQRLFQLKSKPHAWFSRFSTVVCGDDPAVKAFKPAPDIFLTAAARLNVRASDCVVIEDSPSGVMAARRAGMRVIALPAPELESGALGDADLIVQSHAEVRAALLSALERV